MCMNIIEKSGWFCSGHLVKIRLPKLLGKEFLVNTKLLNRNWYPVKDKEYLK